MKSSTQEITPIIGTAMGGGYYAGRILIDGQNVAVKGPKGTLELSVAEPIKVGRNEAGEIGCGAGVSVRVQDDEVCRVGDVGHH